MTPEQEKRALEHAAAGLTVRAIALLVGAPKSNVDYFLRQHRGQQGET